MCAIGRCGLGHMISVAVVTRHSLDSKLIQPLTCPRDFAPFWPGIFQL